MGFDSERPGRYGPHHLMSAAPNVRSRAKQRRRFGHGHGHVQKGRGVVTVTDEHVEPEPKDSPGLLAGGGSPP